MLTRVSEGTTAMDSSILENSALGLFSPCLGRPIIVRWGCGRRLGCDDVVFLCPIWETTTLF
jgi:hypothetical protein